MFRVALCDDDRRFLELLKDRAEMFCVEKARNVKFSAFSDSDILMGMTERGEIFDAYILDIEMQDYSGIEIAEEIRKKSKMACIIFLTSHMKYAVGACGTGIFRYMMKEDLDRELPRILDDLFSHLECLESHYFYVIQNQKPVRENDTGPAVPGAWERRGNIFPGPGDHPESVPCAERWGWECADGYRTRDPFQSWPH